MDRFGARWERHWERIERSWRERIDQDDVVLIPGDHSWAMRLDEAEADLSWLAALPGHKVLIRGNHDYWWQSLGKIRSRFPGLTFLQNDAYTIGDVTICGSRGWNLPGRGFSDPEDEKIYKRELERLRLSAQGLSPTAPHRVAMLHYPPLLPQQMETDFTRILEEARIEACVYGHLHAGSGHRPVQGLRRGVSYHLVACDQIDFQPVELEWSRISDAASHR
jgi:predicted phosphohydrolase